VSEANKTPDATKPPVQKPRGVKPKQKAVKYNRRSGMTSGGFKNPFEVVNPPPHRHLACPTEASLAKGRYWGYERYTAEQYREDQENHGTYIVGSPVLEDGLVRVQDHVWVWIPTEEYNEAEEARLKAQNRLVNRMGGPGAALTGLPESNDAIGYGLEAKFRTGVGEEPPEKIDDRF